MIFEPAESTIFHVDHIIDVKLTKISKKFRYKTSEIAQKVIHVVQVIFLFEIPFNFS